MKRLLYLLALLAVPALSEPYRDFGPYRNLACDGCGTTFLGREAAPTLVQAWTFPALTWEPKSMEDVVAFRIDRKDESCTIVPASVPWSIVTTLAKTERSYVDTTAKYQHGYCYVVSAIYPKGLLQSIVYIER